MPARCGERAGIAAAPAGGYGWRSGLSTQDLARAEARALCLKPDAKRSCKVVDDEAAE